MFLNRNNPEAVKASIDRMTELRENELEKFLSKEEARKEKKLAKEEAKAAARKDADTE